MKTSNFSNCPYDYYKIWQSHSTTKGAPAWAIEAESDDWDLRNSQNQPENDQKKAIFGLFSIFSKTVHTIRTKFFTVIFHHIRVLYVQLNQNRMTGK